MTTSGRPTPAPGVHPFTPSIPRDICGTCVREGVTDIVYTLPRALVRLKQLAAGISDGCQR